MSSPAARPPFDDADWRIAQRYLNNVGLKFFDPDADPIASEDLIFVPSLAGARRLIAQSFGGVRADGCAFRGYALIIDRPSVTAFAVEYQGLQICGLDVGLALAVYELSAFVFAQATLFPEIGDASQERSPDLPPGAQLSFWIADQLRAGGRADGQPAGIELVPWDPQRHFVAYFLTQLLLRFVWLHELFHCLNGHTGLRVAEEENPALDEVFTDQRMGLIEIEADVTADARRMQLHCMEFDADGFACWALVGMQQADLEPIDGMAPLSRPVRLKLSLFAAFLMTFFFDQAARRQPGSTEGTYPLAYHRLHNLVRTIASDVTLCEGENRQAFQAVLAEMQALGLRVPQFVSVKQLIQDLRDPVLQGLFDKIEGSLTKVRSSVRPFAYRTPA